MTTVEQTMLGDDGEAWSGFVRFTALYRIGTRTGDHHGAVTTEVEAGALSVDLRGPQHYQVEVGANRPFLVIVPASGTVTLDEIMLGEDAASSGTFWYSTIAALLAIGSESWSAAGTTNSYGTDGIISGWQRILKTDPAASGLADNGDSVLETDDGLAFAVRTWISG